MIPFREIQLWDNATEN